MAKKIPKCSKKEMNQFRKAEMRLGNRTDWELKNMKRALNFAGGLMNTPEENERLKDVHTVLKLKNKCRK